MTMNTQTHTPTFLPALAGEPPTAHYLSFPLTRKGDTIQFYVKLSPLGGQVLHGTVVKLQANEQVAHVRVDGDHYRVTARDYTNHIMTQAKWRERMGDKTPFWIL